MKLIQLSSLISSVVLSLTTGMLFGQTQTQVFQATLPVVNVPTSFTIDFPQFNPDLGVLKKISFDHANVYAGNGNSTAVGGTFVPPNWVAGWAFGGTLEFSFVGPGFDLTEGPFLSRGGSSSQPDPTHIVEFNFDAATFFSSVECINSTSSFFQQYIGNGTVPLVFGSQFVPDSGTGGDGCVWSGADITEIACNSAFISQSVATVTYEYNPPVLLGDVNCDGAVNLLDVGPFIDLLSKGGYDVKADINEDGFLNLLDVDGFVALLAG